jgi:CubicO group peptidase (beta-lactamase class C family)
MIDYGTFDSHLMNRIQNTFKPYGFAYSIYELHSNGPVRKAHNSHGYRNKSKDTISIHSVTEMDSMSKTITAVSMLKLISKIPEVRTAYDAAKSTATGSSAWTTWNDKVNKYLDHKISGLMPPRSQTGINWNHLPAAKTITIKNLLLHTSGLDPNAGDDPGSIEGALKNWTGTTSSTVYANPNYDLFRYIIPVFSDKYVTPQPLLAAFEALQQMPFGAELFEIMIGALYAVIVQEDVMKIFPSTSLPSIQPWGSQVEFANQAGTHFWDIMNDVGPWSTLCGSWGWKMSVDQYAKLMASVADGTVMPKEYWMLMTQSADTHGYGYGVYWVDSDQAKVKSGGRYYTHNGADGTSPEIAGEGFWIAWGSTAMAFRLDSPLEGSYGMPSSTAPDNSLANLWDTVDAALNAALT